MADINSKADLIRAGYKGYAGWGETEALADYRATGGSGKYDAGGASMPGQTSAQATNIDLASQFKKAQELISQAKQPAIQSLEASKPEVAASFGQQREALATQQTNMQSRYQNLLADIKGKEEKAINQTTKVTANELGARGIAPNSTFYDQSILGVQQPIQSEYAGFTRDIGQAQSEEEASYANLAGQLTSQEVAANRDIANAIAAIQSATSQDAVNVALQELSRAQQAQQFAQSQAQQASQFQQSFGLEQSAQQLAQDQYSKEWPYKQAAYEYDLNKPYYKADPASPYQQLVDIFGKDTVAGWFGDGNDQNTTNALGVPKLDLTNPYESNSSARLK